MHDCCLPSNPTPEYLKKVEEIKCKDRIRDEYAVACGYQVVKIRECEWKSVIYFTISVIIEILALTFRIKEYLHLNN